MLPPRVVFSFGCAAALLAVAAGHPAPVAVSEPFRVWCGVTLGHEGGPLRARVLDPEGGVSPAVRDLRVETVIRDAGPLRAAVSLETTRDTAVGWWHEPGFAPVPLSWHRRGPEREVWCDQGTIRARPRLTLVHGDRYDVDAETVFDRPALR